MGQAWYYFQHGKKLGPLTSADLKKLAASGVLSPDDQVQGHGTEPVSARMVRGLFPDVPPVVVPAPEPPAEKPSEVDAGAKARAEEESRYYDFTSFANFRMAINLAVFLLLVVLAIGSEGLWISVVAVILWMVFSSLWQISAMMSFQIKERHLQRKNRPSDGDNREGTTHTSREFLRRF